MIGLVLLIVAVPFSIGLYAGWITTDRDWHCRLKHTCGFTTRYLHRTEPCARCGKFDGNWESSISRASLIPFVYEKMPPERVRAK